MKWLMFEKNSLKMKYKYGYAEDDFMEVDFCRQKRRLNETLERVGTFEPDIITEEQLISAKKYDDLQKLMDYVPPIHQVFYSTLKKDPSTTNMMEHPDIVEDTDSEEDTGDITRNDFL